MVADNLVEISEHILTATVTNIVISGAPDDLADDRIVGFQTDYPKIRMDLLVLTNEVLKTTATELPNSIILEASCPRIDYLGAIRSNYVGKTSLFFLKGNQFSPVFEDDPELPRNVYIWMQDLSNKPEIIEAIEKEKARQAASGYRRQEASKPDP